MNKQTKKIKKIIIFERKEIKIDYSCCDGKTIDHFLISETIIDIINSLREYEMSLCYPCDINLIIVLSDGHCVYPSVKKWVHGKTLPDNYRDVFDFDEIIKRKHKKISAMLVYQHNCYRV